MLKNDILFNSVLAQIKYFQDGSITKFKDIFNKAVRYSEIELSNIGYCSYIYLDFLITSGLLEKHRQDRLRYSETNAIFTLEGSPWTYKLATDNVKIFTTNSNIDLFPSIIPITNSSISDCMLKSNFWNILNKINFDFEPLYNKKSTSLQLPYCEKFNFINKRWQSETSHPEADGIYKITDRFQNIYYIKFDGDSYSLNDLDWAFIIFKKLKGTLSELFEMKNLNLVIPWKIKFPPIIKRILLNISDGVNYSRAGISYLNCNKQELSLLVFKLNEGSGFNNNE